MFDVVGGLVLGLVGVAVLALVISLLVWIGERLSGFGVFLAEKFLDLKEKAQDIKLNSVRVLPQDENGRTGILYDGQIFRDANSGAVFTMELDKHFNVTQLKLDNIQKTLLAMKGISMPQQALDAIEADSQIQVLPDYLTLEGAMRQYNVHPSIHSVLLGVGQNGPVLVDMEDAVHMLVSGASGFGKSTLMEAIAKQLVIGKDCDLCFIDYGVNTFGMLEQYASYPIADSVDMAIELLRQLISEGLRRKELMRGYPRAKTIYDYNEQSGDNIRAIVCFIDESASLFTDNDTKQPITELAQMARKFGMWLVLGGTDFKATTIPSSATGNCGARVGFHLMPGLSRSLLNCTDAFELEEKGRALAMIPGQKMQEIQCPIVTSWDDLPTREVKQQDLVVDTLEDRIKEVLPGLERVSVSAVCRALDMATGGTDFYNVRDVLQRMGEI